MVTGRTGDRMSWRIARLICAVLDMPDETTQDAAPEKIEHTTA